MANQVVAEACAELARFDISVIEKFREAMIGVAQAEITSLTKYAQGAKDLTEEQIDDLVAERDTIGDAHSLADELAIVALYRIVEMDTKRILLHHFLSKDVRKCYKIEVLVKKLKADLNVDLSSIEGYAAIDELRCINNAIKHNNVVLPALAAFPGWTVDKELRDLGKAFDRLAPHVPDYLKALALAVVPD